MPSLHPGGTVPATVADITYCLYARKSTESDELQALSIDSQIKEMLDQAKRDGIEVSEIRRESHSAKQSFTRPVFIQLIIDKLAVESRFTEDLIRYRGFMKSVLKKATAHFKQQTLIFATTLNIY